MSTRDDAWILTFTGRRFWPLDPRAEDVCIEDIAHALALKCRFTGHCRDFYSVAQHSVLCAQYVAQHGGSAELQLAALLHDASEAYLPDVARPIKGRFAIVFQSGGVSTPFKATEDKLQDVIHLALGIGRVFEFSLIKDADMALLLSERRDLMPPHDHCWAKANGAEHLELWPEKIRGWSCHEAKMRFETQWELLREEVARG